MKQKLLRGLLYMSNLLFQNKSEPEWKALNATFHYSIPQTASRCTVHFNPRAKRLTDTLNTDWYKMQDSGPYKCKIRFDGLRLLQFELNRDNETIMEIDFSVEDQKKKQNILASVVTGSPNSLFRYHYPSGLDVTPLLGPVLSHLMELDCAEIVEVLPVVLNVSIGDQIKYDRRSLSVNLLFDETFEECTLHV